MKLLMSSIHILKHYFYHGTMIDVLIFLTGSKWFSWSMNVSPNVN